MNEKINGAGMGWEIKGSVTVFEPIWALYHKLNEPNSVQRFHTLQLTVVSKSKIKFLRMLISFIKLEHSVSYETPALRFNMFLFYGIFEN